MKTLRTAVAVGLMLGPWERALAAPQQPIPLWPKGAPGSEGKTANEIVRITEQGEHIVSSVHRPSITPYLPDAAIATGAAVIVIPGGGHRELWMDHEGYRVGQWLSDHGVAAFVLKYRLARETGSTYTIERDALADVQRAIRIVRSRASEFHVATDRVGVIGFSAGGELAALAGTRYAGVTRTPNDPIDRESVKPAFMGLIYPAIPSDMPVSKDTPAAFLLAGERDAPAVSEGIATVYLAMKRAGASAEMHVLAGVGHGFGVRESNPPAVANWIVDFHDWLDARGMLGERRVSGSISAQMRDGIAGARDVPVYTAGQRASAVQRMLKLAAPPVLNATATLTPNAPYGPSGAHLSFWKPSFVLGTISGGEVGVNFWGIHNDGHVNVGFTPRTAKSYSVDCRLLSTGRITYKVFAGDKDTLGHPAEVELIDNHIVLVVPVLVSGGPISVELWPTPVTQPMGFLGCDLATIDMGAEPR